MTGTTVICSDYEIYYILCYRPDGFVPIDDTKFDDSEGSIATYRPPLLLFYTISVCCMLLPLLGSDDEINYILCYRPDGFVPIDDTKFDDSEGSIATYRPPLLLFYTICVCCMLLPLLGSDDEINYILCYRPDGFVPIDDTKFDDSEGSIATYRPPLLLFYTISVCCMLLPLLGSDDEINYILCYRPDGFVPIDDTKFDDSEGSIATYRPPLLLFYTICVCCMLLPLLGSDDEINYILCYRPDGFVPIDDTKFDDSEGSIATYRPPLLLFYTICVCCMLLPLLGSDDEINYILCYRPDGFVPIDDTKFDDSEGSIDTYRPPLLLFYTICVCCMLLPLLGSDDEINYILCYRPDGFVPIDDTKFDDSEGSIATYRPPLLLFYTICVCCMLLPLLGSDDEINYILCYRPDGFVPIDDTKFDDSEGSIATYRPPLLLFYTICVCCMLLPLLGSDDEINYILCYRPDGFVPIDDTKFDDSEGSIATYRPPLLLFYTICVCCMLLPLLGSDDEINYILCYRPDGFVPIDDTKFDDSK